MSDDKVRHEIIVNVEDNLEVQVMDSLTQIMDRFYEEYYEPLSKEKPINAQNHALMADRISNWFRQKYKAVLTDENGLMTHDSFFRE